MAYIVPPTFTSGAILTAAQMTILGNDILAGGPIYATEAARDAAIPAPFEGQRAYITGSTVAAATGLVTAVPTGIQTIYNGAAWVCVTPVASSTATAGTTLNTSYNSTLTSGGANPTVTVSTGTTALVSLSADALSGSAGTVALMTVGISGASSIAAADGFAVLNGNAQRVSIGTTLVITGLTAGTNTFTLFYATATPGVVCTFLNRRLVVQGIA